MRFGKKEVVPPRPVKVVLFREDGEGNPDNITFLCGPVIDYTEFERLCPEPKPPHVTNIKAGTSYPDTNDPKYKVKLLRWNELRVAWLMLTSLSATPDLIWETVDLSNPETWKNYEKEMRKVVTEAEFNRVMNGILDANAPTENRRKEALDVFSVTASAEEEHLQSQTGEPTTSSSGEPANG